MSKMCFEVDPLEEEWLQTNVQAITDKVFWCHNCNVPLLTERCHKCNSIGKYCGANLKPIFPKEKSFFEEKIRSQLNIDVELPDNLLLGTAHRIIYAGDTLIKFSPNQESVEIKNFNQGLLRDVSEISFDKFYKKAFEANLPPLKFLEKESLMFIKKTSKEFSNNKKYVLFSGGKDSALAATLVKKAIGDLPLFFSDTTIELEDTLNYIKDFSKKYGFDVISEKSEKNFINICDNLGPPSHLMRWCCTVFKAYPVSKFLDTVEGNILTFDGIRKAESDTRSKYPRIYRNKKIPRQTVTRPIFYWPTLAVWLYLLKYKIILNSAYKKGFKRVGCYPCPFTSKYDEVLLKHYYSNDISKWEEFLVNFSMRHGKGYDLKWVKEGHWKKRKPNKKRNKSVLQKMENDALVFSFQDTAIDKDILEFFKPFGDIQFITPSSFKINGHRPYDIRGMLGGPYFSVHSNSKILKKDILRLRRQIEKSINCVECGGCTPACPKGAINTNRRFTIDSTKCTHCMGCVDSKFTKMGCIALSFKSETKRIYVEGEKEDYSTYFKNVCKLSLAANQS